MSDKELGTIEERCHEETIIESAPHAIRRIRDEILKAKKEIKNMSSISATQYGQIIEDIKEHTDQDTEQTEEE